MPAVLGFFGGAMFMLFVLALSGARPADVYRDGQVDALTGKIKYRLETKPDSTREWVRIEGK